MLPSSPLWQHWSCMLPLAYLALIHVENTSVPTWWLHFQQAIGSLLWGALPSHSTWLVASRCCSIRSELVCKAGVKVPNASESMDLSVWDVGLWHQCFSCLFLWWPCRSHNWTSCSTWLVALVVRLCLSYCLVICTGKRFPKSDVRVQASQPWPFWSLEFYSWLLDVSLSSSMFEETHMKQHWRICDWWCEESWCLCDVLSSNEQDTAFDGLHGLEVSSGEINKADKSYLFVFWRNKHTHLLSNRVGCELTAQLLIC